MSGVNSVRDTVGKPAPTEGPLRLGRGPAVVAGVLGIGAALAVGQFLAAFVGANASPYLAVGDAAINLTPGWLKDFAVSAFGTNDKLVLLSVMGVVLLAFGVLAGLVSRRGPVPGSVFAVLLGVLGMAAVVARTDLGQLAVLAPAGSIVGGVLVFNWLHRVALRLAAARRHREEHPDEPALDVVGGPEDSRRRFLVTAGGVAVGAGALGFAGQAIGQTTSAAGSRAAVGVLRPASTVTIPAGADFAAVGTPSFLTGVSDFYRVDTALTVPQVRTDGWSLRIHGMVDKEVVLDYANIRNRALVERVITLTCVSNPVGGPYVSTATWIGVPLRDLLLEAGVRPGADQLLSTSVDGYTAGTPVDTLLDPNRGALLAIGMNGQPLPVEHGFPARMVVPGLYGYVSATKWVTDLELTTFAAKQGYWVPRGYSQRAPIKTESRIDVPASFAHVKSGSTVVAGIAWAQTRGIAKVEVRVDGGPWVEAQLSTEVNKNTWRMWRAFVDLRPGNHTAECRATDDTGAPQTSAAADPIPDGATGWPSVSFVST